jgi:hypothetical protein
VEIDDVVENGLGGHDLELVSVQLQHGLHELLQAENHNVQKRPECSTVKSGTEDSTNLSVASEANTVRTSPAYMHRTSCSLGDVLETRLDASTCEDVRCTCAPRVPTSTNLKPHQHGTRGEQEELASHARAGGQRRHRSVIQHDPHSAYKQLQACGMRIRTSTSTSFSRIAMPTTEQWEIMSHTGADSPENSARRARRSELSVR